MVRTNFDHSILQGSVNFKNLKSMNKRNCIYLVGKKNTKLNKK